MKITVFAKKRTTSEGKKFYSYLSKLTKKDGSVITASVKFPEDNVPKIDDFPISIEFEKSDANLSTTTYTKEETGEEFESRTLWLKKYSVSKEKYVDTSLDEF